MDDVKWTERSLYPKEGRMVDVKQGVNKRTGEEVVETKETEIPWAKEWPGFSWQSSSDRLADDKRWEEKLRIAQETNATAPPTELPDLDTEAKTYQENIQRASVGKKTFGGLGGLLGPNGKLRG